MPTTHTLLLEADALLVTSGDLEPDAFAAALDAWVGAASDKAERIAAVRIAALAKAQMHRDQVDAHNARRRHHETTADWCGASMLALLEARRELGEAPRIDGVARLQRNGGVAPLSVDLARLPAAFVRYVESADNAAIRAALGRGEEIPGASLGDVGESVRWER